MSERRRCPFADLAHNYTTVVVQHYQVPGNSGEPLDRSYTFVVCTKCGDVISVGAE